MDSSAQFPLFCLLRVVRDINGRPFISYLSPKGPFNDHSPNCLLPLSEQQPAEIRPTSIEVAWPVTGGLRVRVLILKHSYCMGGFFSGISIYSVNQTGVQRLLSLRNNKRAKLALLISIPLMTFLFLSSCLHGIILYAVYFMCDPILNSRETGLTKYDQLVPYFLVSKFYSIPGLTGLSLAGIFSGSLTTISSILNSLATVTVVDFVHPIFQSLQRNEKKSLLLAKGLLNQAPFRRLNATDPSVDGDPKNSLFVKIPRSYYASHEPGLELEREPVPSKNPL
ncbi:hypothetical protein AVEN_225507-1 [Araneus ventricosus]|uniref:Sodium-coupled monocarboxylate transporter 2 n=1 Tax=Araneus ventricosus TaxID=182803 RepID=A0A4Y2U5B2_ARAVE|nr:hypothetical protein AVEN_225507-1 [Araneus ventricosus]